MDFSILYMWLYAVFGISGTALLAEVATFLVVILLFVLFYINGELGGALPVILKCNSKLKALILLKPYNIWLVGEIIGDTLHVEWKGQKMCFFIGDKKPELIFGGKNFFTFEMEEIYGMGQETREALVKLAEKIDEEEIEKYVEAVKSYYETEKMLKNGSVSPEYKEKLQEHLEKLRNYIQWFEKSNEFQFVFEPKSKYIGWRRINFPAIKQFYRDGSPSMLYNLAKQYGYAVQNKEKPDYMKLAFVFIMLLIGGAIAYVMISSGQGHQVAQTVMNTTTATVG